MTAITASTLRGWSGTAISRIASWAVLVAAADFLLYGHVAGWVQGLLYLLLLSLAAINSPSSIARPYGAFLLAACAAMCLAMIESPGIVANILFWLFFAALFTDMRPEHAVSTWLRKLLRFIVFLLGGAVIRDGLAAVRGGYTRRSIPTLGYDGGVRFLSALVRGWFLPVLVVGVFLMLFASANPVLENWLVVLDSWLIGIENWLLSFSLEGAGDFLTLERLLFWLAAGVIYWGALRAPTIRLPERPARSDISATSQLVSALFARGPVTRTLILSNLLFLAQNVLDANFLWAGAALPEGITYAQYAHRGAYPLLLTALLAAAFVLIAMRETGGLKHDRAVRSLIFLWLVQNVLLVFSSIWRTELYVAEYSLTFLRLSALLWMGLVLFGLMAVAVKLVLDKPNHWLVGVNLAAALALMTASCFVDMGRFIAAYNIAHSREMGGGGQPLDLSYLADLGPSALPPLISARERLISGGASEMYVNAIPVRLQGELEAAVADWRRWTFRAHRLTRELNIGRNP